MDDINTIKPIKEELRPKYMPVKCVVCNGHGTVGYAKRICHGCKGKGFILVETEEENK